LVPVLDNGAELPGKGRIGPTLAMIVAALGQVPEVVDDAGTDERAAFGVPSDAPRVARPLGKQLELAGLRMNAEQDTGEAEILALVLDGALVEDAVEAVEPAIGAPGQRVGQLMGVGTAKAGDDYFRLAGRLTVGAFLVEEDVRSVGHVNAAV